ncbi:glutamate carboxypeptidase [Betaproteobacteria bacterium GR16-43]|nr:glutamate carboxypeptidase [Betaproteobacteria bacterium GR16-43]
MFRHAALVLATVAAGSVLAEADPRINALAREHKPAMLETMRELVGFESGSREIDELDRIAAHIAVKFRALGAQVEWVESTEAQTTRFSDTPERIGKMVKATFTGSGKARILLLAHMDTVYPKGMLAKQPFRIDGNRAYGLGIADDKQGIALILHVMAMLKSLDFRDYGTITVLVNGDEEISSPAGRYHQALLGESHDVVLSYEGGGSPEEERLRLATSGIALAHLNVSGRASHAGSAPERGVNALDELAFQIGQMRDLSDPKTGIKVNWTLAKAGVVHNMIPPDAHATADVRVERVSDFDVAEKAIRARIRKQLLPEAKVELVFERHFLPLELRPVSRALAAHAQSIYSEIGRPIKVIERSTGGGTDASNAAVRAKGPVIEGFGLQGFGSHSANAEYVVIDDIEPKLYLSTRLIMDIAKGRAPAP